MKPQTKTVKNNFGYIALAYASLFCYGLLDNTRGPAYPVITEKFGIDQSIASLIFVLAAMSGLFVIILGRKWLRLVGEFKAQLLFNLLISIGFMGMGLSGLWAKGYSLMLVASIVLGLGLGGSMISTNVLIAFGSRPNNRRRIFSGLHSMYGIAAILAPVIFGLVVGSGFRWQFLFIILSLLPLVVSIAGMKGQQIIHDEERSKKPHDTNFSRRLKIGLIIAFYVSAEIAITSRLVLYISKTENLSAVAAAPYLSLFFILFLAGRLTFSIFKFPWSSFNLMMFSLASSLLLFLLGILAHPIFLIFCGLTMSYYFPCGMDWLSKRFHKNAGFILTSVTTTVDALLIFMHWGIGIAADAYGLKTAMMIGPLFLLSALILLALSRNEFEYEGAPNKKPGH